MKCVALIALALILSACAQQQKRDFSAFNAVKPRSILVVPVVNQSLDVDAPNYVLSTLAFPLAEKGYYVFPLNTTKVVLEHEGLYEPEQVWNVPASRLAQLFGADTILYVTINRWDAQYALISTTVTVQFDYKMVDHDGNKIWDAQQTMAYSPQNQNTGNPLANLIASAIIAAMERAKPNYMPLTQQANNAVFIAGPNAIPNGPYSPEQIR